MKEIEIADRCFEVGKRLITQFLYIEPCVHVPPRLGGLHVNHSYTSPMPSFEPTERLWRALGTTSHRPLPAGAQGRASKLAKISRNGSDRSISLR